MGRGMPHRLEPSDLEQLGTYLFGPRWQTALAHAVHRDPRLVRRWLAGGRKVTRHSAMLVEAMVRETYAKRMRRPNADFLLMVAGQPAPHQSGITMNRMGQRRLPARSE